jgi:hypothetical protein
VAVTNEQAITRLKLVLVDVETLQHEIAEHIAAINAGKYSGQAVADTYDAFDDSCIVVKIDRQLEHLGDEEGKWEEEFGEE